ncbi:hypothetical protein ASPWEDRAFT_149237 [Aspergillus wentii DTO 134E9]|uniref:Phytanoyl-CoA dioxygenase family protein n=1 Tax=Aspergillus wentii DTO 134E9 TaxID=1073089 RepID=A0A1L9RV01_ASPWE|nr:uncharacterized protein ASPWEDRAFT_149237 [Aspergillus wentii DTO 134E9]KAI9928660.1 hypothetical protein MW887_001876 [Aspergillus wentii]OJJ38745.1 hypothetical protein ASPWEDRAFT_149237 [Aspergillus wentii DTO 134E9]
MPQVKHFSASADPHDVLQYLKADGVVVIEGATTRQAIDAVLEELSPSVSSSPQTFGLAAKSSTFATHLLMNPLYIDLVKRILTNTCIIYYERERTVSTSEPQVSCTSVITANPGAEGWGPRRQDECHHVPHPAKRETDFGILYAATDITRENGAVRVAIGSNHWTDTRYPHEDEETLIELRKGDAILTLGSVYYGQAANTTTIPSTLLVAFATPGYRRQEENQYLAVPWEVAGKYPTAVQRFLGYAVSRPYGGSVEHMEPLDYLKVKGDWSKYIPVDLI